MTFANPLMTELVGVASAVGLRHDALLGLHGAFAAIGERATDTSSTPTELSCRVAGGRQVKMAAGRRVADDGSVTVVLVDVSARHSSRRLHKTEGSVACLMAGCVVGQARLPLVLGVLCVTFVSGA